jgi:maltose alpha-D-glucosyltransferase/alpha-amylase
MLDNNPLWYKDALIYELHVRAFHDSVGDGTGDFRGLTQKLDYLQDLGVTAIWLLPFYPSPLKDDGYDIADYRGIHPDYGTIDDFKEFMDAAHKRGLRVITELVINHTSDEHPWFKRARRAKPGSSERNFYVWSDTADKYRGARIIFQDFEHSNWTWDDLAGAYYWHRFYRHQPDLNYDNPDVWKAIFPVVDFWMDLGVDGMRLDAVPYLFEREGTSCENLPETHEFLKALRQHVDKRYPNRMFLAEANQWPEDAVAYFGAGDECQMNFHFPIMPRLFMSIHMEDRFPIVDILEQTPAIPETCQWALFLRNHDELTLEMVTDEERDYMYRAYALDPRARINLGIRRRLAPLLGNNRRRIELMKGLLFSLPGTPILYYGDEIGMGDNIYLGDRNGVRTPMQWSADRNAGFSRCNPQKLYMPVIIDPEYHFESVNVEAQQNNSSSLLWWMKRLIALRKSHRAFGRGRLEFLHPDNHKILAFLRRYTPPSPHPERDGAAAATEECILVIANLSRFVQYVELDLSEFERFVPVEMFGRVSFPAIGSTPYLLTLGPHSFYWFVLNPPVADAAHPAEGTDSGEKLPVLEVERDWNELLAPPLDANLEAALPQYLQPRRWFGAKARTLKAATLHDIVPLVFGDERAYLTLVAASFQEGGEDTYVVPLAYAEGEHAAQLQRELPHMIIARVKSAQCEGLVYDALASPTFCTSVLRAIGRNRLFTTSHGASLLACHFAQFGEARGPEEEAVPGVISKAEQSNTSVLYGNRLILKVFRRVHEGLNPDQEVGRYLTDVAHFTNAAPVVGAVEFRRRRKSEPMTLALLQGYVPNQGDAWQHTLDVLSSFYERALAFRNDQDRAPPAEDGTALDLAMVETTARAEEMIDTYLETARLLARRTAEMHLALAAPTDDPGFRPEPMTPLYQRGRYQSLRNLTNQIFLQLRHRQNDIPRGGRKLARRLLDIESRVFEHIRSIKDTKIAATRTRTHGDYHLGQVLYTGKDFVIIDFEGEPSRSINERRQKRSPLRDVAGMMRSFHYAACSALYGNGGRGSSPGMIRPEDVPTLEPWARFWHTWVSATYLRAYCEAAAGASFLPKSQDELKVLVKTSLLEKAIYELGYELNHRPDWVKIPLLGVLDLLETTE